MSGGQTEPGQDADRHNAVDGARRVPALVAAGIAAVALAAAAGGALWLPDDGTADRASALARGAVGAAIGLAVAAIALLVLHLTGVFRWRRSHLGVVAAAAVVAMALGLLIGAANAGPESEARDPETDETVNPEGGGGGEFGEEGVIGENATASLIDADGDGEPDVDDNGQLLIALDADGDGDIDGRLVPCSESPELDGEPGTINVDAGCDGSVDRVIRLSPRLLPVVPDEWSDTEFDSDELEEFDDGDGEQPEEGETADDGAQPDEGDEGDEGDDSDDSDGSVSGVVKTLLIIAAALLALFIAARMWHAWRNRLPTLERADDEPEEESAVDAEAVDAAIEESIDTLLGHPDPRVAIRAAYAVLLDAFAEAGFARLPYEAPEEHLTRCLRGLAVEPEPMRELLRLFAVARFSTHTVGEAERGEALTALRASQAELRRQVLQPAGGPPAGSWPPPGGR